MIEKIILRPLITEKSTHLVASGKYAFIIKDDAGKSEVKKALKAIYKVDVKDVKIVKKPAKTKKRGRFVGQTKAIKKAIVTLAKDQKIEGFEEVKK